jgi:hypothetical protein
MVKHLQPGDSIEVYCVELVWVGSAAVRGEVMIVVGLADEAAERVDLALDDSTARTLVRRINAELAKGEETP